MKSLPARISSRGVVALKAVFASFEEAARDWGHFSAPFLSKTSWSQTAPALPEPNVAKAVRVAAIIERGPGIPAVATIMPALIPSRADSAEAVAATRSLAKLKALGRVPAASAGRDFPKTPVPARAKAASERTGGI